MAAETLQRLAARDRRGARAMCAWMRREQRAVVRPADQQHGACRGRSSRRPGRAQRSTGQLLSAAPALGWTATTRSPSSACRAQKPCAAVRAALTSTRKLARLGCRLAARAPTRAQRQSRQRPAPLDRGVLARHARPGVGQQRRAFRVSAPPTRTGMPADQRQQRAPPVVGSQHHRQVVALAPQPRRPRARAARTARPGSRSRGG